MKGGLAGEPNGEVMEMAQKSAYFSLKNVSNRHEAQAIRDVLDTLPGVKSVSVSDSGQVAVDFDSTGVSQGQVRKKMENMGFEVTGEYVRSLTD